MAGKNANVFDESRAILTTQRNNLDGDGEVILFRGSCLNLVRQCDDDATAAAKRPRCRCFRGRSQNVAAV